MHPEPLRVRRDPRERRLVHLFSEVEKAGDIAPARCDAREPSHASFICNRCLRATPLVRTTLADEPLETLEQRPNFNRLVSQVILDGPHIRGYWLNRAR